MPQKTEQSLAIHGATGRMGQEILLLAQKDGAWERITTVARGGWGDVAAASVDVVIDFSSPAGLAGAFEWCLKNGKALVSGTTGLNESEMNRLREAANKIPVLWAANMSLGVPILAKAMAHLKSLTDWDFQIDEIHHTMKKDKPSGTALFLQQELQQITKKNLPEPNSTRGGGVVGIHRVLALGAEEMLVFEHHALSRAVFARGALTAARWLGKRKGKAKLYTMADVLSDL